MTLPLRDYVNKEVLNGYGGSLYLDAAAFQRFVTALTSRERAHWLCLHNNGVAGAHTLYLMSLDQV